MKCTTCPCNDDYVCDIHDDSPTGLQELYQQMFDDGVAEYNAIMREYQEEMEVSNV